MCIEDIRIGRSLGTDFVDQSANVGTTNPVCGTDQNRVTLVFMCARNGPVIVAPTGVAIDATHGLAVNIGQHPVVLRVQEWGPLIQGQWFAADAGAGSTLLVATASLPKQ